MTETQESTLTALILKALEQFNQTNYCYVYPIQAAYTPPRRELSRAGILDIWWVDGVSRVELEQTILATIEMFGLPCNVQIVIEESKFAFKSSAMFIQLKESGSKLKLRLHRFYTFKAFNIAAKILTHTCANFPELHYSPGGRFDLDSAFTDVARDFAPKMLDGTLVDGRPNLVPVLNTVRVSNHRYFKPTLTASNLNAIEFNNAIAQFPNESIEQVLVNAIDDRTLPTALLDEKNGLESKPRFNMVKATIHPDTHLIAFTDTPDQRFTDALYCCGYAQVASDKRVFIPADFPDHAHAARIIKDINSLKTLGFVEGEDPFRKYLSDEFTSWSNYPTRLTEEIDTLIDRSYKPVERKAAHRKFAKIRQALISVQQLSATAPPSPFAEPFDYENVQFAFGRIRTFNENDALSALLGACALASENGHILEVSRITPILEERLELLFYDPESSNTEVALADLQKFWYKFRALVETGEIASGNGKGIPLSRLGISLE
jgi:hypothetical protein